MARLDLSGLSILDELMNGLSDLSTDIDEVAKDCIDAAAPTLADALQSNIQSAAHRVSSPPAAYTLSAFATSEKIVKIGCKDSETFIMTFRPEKNYCRNYT